MKTISKIQVLIFGCALALTGCVNDLNTKPIDKNSATSFNQDAVFSKCYATLALSGQKGPDGDCDIDDLDEGVSSFYRMVWELNEFCTDEGWWIWNDVGLADIRIMNWNGDNSLVKGLYYRFNIDIKYCNHFLANADDALPKTAYQKAEVRFLRALNAWYMLDMFRVAPFTTSDMKPFIAEYPSGRKIQGQNTDYPPFLTRQELYEWLEEELKEVITLLPEERLYIYRVDKTAARLLLARLYLNAEVYTGTAQWQKAADMAQEALAGNYSLLRDETVTDSSFVYTAYQKLFMGDNNTNGAQQESPLLIYQDGVYCRCWGGSRFVVNMVRDGGMIPSGSADTWKCFRTSPEFVSKWVDLDNAEGLLYNEYNMPGILGDDRAIMCSYSDSAPDLVWTLKGDMSADFYACWSVLKFNNVMSTASTPALSVSVDPNWTDTDLPLLRIAEAYMIDAEAQFRLGNVDEALTIINNSVRSRANAEPLATLDETTLCDEWSREFYCEGRRRTDLIRFHRFAGPEADAAAYTWEGRGNQKSGNPYVSMPAKWNWYPVPNDDKGTNPNYKTLAEGDGY